MLRRRQFEETTLIELIYSIEFSVKNEGGNITDMQIQYDIKNSIYKASVFYTVWD